MTAAAESYARLLLEQDLPEAVMAQVRALAAEPELRAALENPAYDRGEKQAVTDRLFPPEARPFFRVLCGRGDCGLLPEILAEYDALVRRRDGVVKVTFTCVHEPAPEQRTRVEELVRRKYGKRAVEWHTVLDPALLGGFILTADDWVLDRSLRTMAEDLRRHVTGGVTV